MTEPLPKPDHKYRIGIVGLGFGRQVLIPAFRLCKRSTVTAICASSSMGALSAAKALGIDKAYGSWCDLVGDNDIDAIAIATPPALQGKIALAALESGKAVFCDKPLAVNLIDAKNICSLAASSKLANIIDFEFPEIAQWQQAKALLADNVIGKLRHISITWNVETYAIKAGLDSWKTRQEEGGGVLNLFASHCFNYIEWFAGPIDTLSVNLAKAAGDSRSGCSLVFADMQLQSGVPVSLNVSGQSFLGNGHCLYFYGDQGTLMLSNETSDYTRGFRIHLGTRSSAVFQEIVNASIPVAKAGTDISFDGRIEAVSKLVDKFVHWLATGAAAKPNFADGLRVQQLLEAALASHRSGQRISLAHLLLAK